MEIPGTTLPIRFIPATVLVAALAACQPETPAVQQPAAAAGVPSVVALFDGLGPGERINFQCSELVLGAAPAADGEAVLLTYSGQRLELPRTESASGTRYADGQGNELMVKNDQSAVLLLAGDSRRECVRSDRPSPWDRAADNGVAYRAIGQEPGWLVEVTEAATGDGASLTAHLDYGQQLVEVLELERSGDSFSGSTATGTRVELAVEQQQCADAMSGERFPTSATLTVGGEEYAGCGAWLAAE